MIRCTTDNTRWLSSLESAYVRIKSPKGGSIDIDKIKMRFFNKEERALVWRCVGEETIGNKEAIVELTRDEMSTLLEMSKRRRY